MPWIAGAAVIGGSLISGSMASSSAKKAAKAQAEATSDAVRLQQQQQAQARGDLAPWREQGGAAINQLGLLLGLTGGGQTGTTRTLVPVTQANFDAAGYLAANPDVAASRWASDPLEHFTKWGSSEGRSIYVDEPNPVVAGNEPEGYGDLLKKFTLADFWDDPVTQASYQQGLDQGTKALENMAGARGNRNSGAQLKALTRFSTDYTGNQAAGSQARYVGDQTNLYNRLAGIAGSGQTAVNTGVQAGQNTANTVSGLLTSQGNARGAAAISRGNAIGGAIQNVGNIFANQSGGQFNPNASYNAAGQFTPFYAGYDSGGGNAYG